MSDDQKIAERLRKAIADGDEWTKAISTPGIKHTLRELCHCSERVLARAEKQAEALKAVEALAYDLDTGGDPEFHDEQCRYMLFGNDADVVERIRAALASADHRDGGEK